MGTKRKSEVLGYYATSGTTEKRLKSLDTTIKPKSELPDAPSDKNEIGSQLIQLEELARQVVSGAESIGDHIGEVGRDVFKAAVELEQKLALARESTRRCVDSSVATPTEPGMISQEGRATGLPVLPPIANQSLERAVFTHPGLVRDFEGDSSRLSYDRLEILGDAYVELIATKLIWKRFQNLPSGRISQMRELLVKNETLAEYATCYGFDNRASVPEDHLRQSKRWTKTKGDIFEAYVAAVILCDPINGYKVAENWLSQLWSPKLAGFDDAKPTLQSKEALAKKIMGKGVKLKYIDERPPMQLAGGMQTFFVGVYLTGWGWDNQHLGSGQGLNKIRAGDQAAHQALLNRPLIDEIAAVKNAYIKAKAEKIV